MAETNAYEDRLLNYIRINREKVILEILKRLYYNEYIPAWKNSPNNDLLLGFPEWIEQEMSIDLKFF